jgi:hypothetical protein
MSDLDLEGVDPDVLIDVLAFVLRRAAGDLVTAHHIASALGTWSSWFSDTAVLCADFAHELDPTHKETP